MLILNHFKINSIPREEYNNIDDEEIGAEILYDDTNRWLHCRPRY
ncbi:7962_t:CDS:2 [Entrophospora sp. SA101]|nr:7962_t:CDS:2 [Entrophospora sp. SA101]